MDSILQCNCGEEYKSEANIDFSTCKIVALRKCPKCGKHTNIRKISSGDKRIKIDID